MTSPKTPQQLAASIEILIASHIDEVRCAAQHAIDRSFSSSRARTKPTTSTRAASARQPAKRRNAEELDDLCDKIYALVCARPGELMTSFAEEIGLSVRALQRPMSKLKSAGRVRSVGERNRMRYFPAVGRTSRSIDV